MKKTLSAVLACAIILLSLAACTPQIYDGKVTVVIGTQEPTEYTLDYNADDITDGLLSVLTLLNISFNESGGFLYSVGELAPTAPEYIYIYTSLSENDDTSSYATTLEYRGVTLTSVGVGARDMYIADGGIIYIGTIIY